MQQELYNYTNSPCEFVVECIVRRLNHHFIHIVPKREKCKSFRGELMHIYAVISASEQGSELYSYKEFKMTSINSLNNDKNH